MEEDRLTVDDEVIKIFIENCNKSLIYCNDLYNFAKQFNLLDTQIFIEWQDALNEISVRYDSRDSTSLDNAE